MQIRTFNAAKRYNLDHETMMYLLRLFVNECIVGGKV